MEDSAEGKTIEKRRPGRPKIHDSTADRLASFRENNEGHRYDIYLDRNAHLALRQIMKQTGLSASKALNWILTKQIELPTERKIMSDESLSPKQMDCADEATEAHTQEILEAHRNRMADLARRLGVLYRDLERHQNKGDDWALARSLEDAIGAGISSPEKIARAEALLAAHNK